MYSVSDPRAEIFMGFVKKLAEAKGYDKSVRYVFGGGRTGAPRSLRTKRKIYKGVSANVTFTKRACLSYVGYTIGNLYLICNHRVVGWSAHRIEELINVDKIILLSYLECERTDL